MSSDADVMISVRGLGKAYTIAHDKRGRPSTLGEAVMQRIRRPLATRADRETFWALRDVSFDVKRGDVVGVIGRNGAGKSTLFKVLSRITEPTAGQVDLYGRVGSLLEVGTGFSGELTGRENIFLNGTILGMRRAEIARRFDEIVDFAGVERFLDTPVKRYSSGMYVRLAFAVAAHLETEILILDEVLAVGDANFQEKCLSKIRETTRSGKTVLFVSHNVQSLKSLCNAGVVLERGVVSYAGDAKTAIACYEKQLSTAVADEFVASTSSAPIRVSRMSLASMSGSPLVEWDCSQEARVQVEVVLEHSAPRLDLSIRLDSPSGEHVFTSFASRGNGILSGLAAGTYEVSFRLRDARLTPGQYTWSVWLHDPMRELFDFHERVLPVRVTNGAINFAVLGSYDTLGGRLCDAESVEVTRIEA